ncbi:MAG: alpha/beta hydrolase fold protein-3 domain protein [Fibrobacteres bacterium]|nr:alpha/beta hydrolase fold protein-3 domain protein [Fibrobacterota bacterium]
MELSLWSGLRIAAAALFFLTGLLAVCKPPSYSFWKLSIVVMEGGHFLVLPLLALGVWCLFTAGPSYAQAGSGSARLAGVLFLLSACLYAATAIRAMAAAARLEREFSNGWAGIEPPPGGFRRAKPLSIPDMFLGIPLPAGAPKTYAYKPADSGDLKLDFYPARIVKPDKPDKPGAAANHHKGPAPCVVVVHGGGWDGGARSQLAPLNAFLAAEGYAVATLQYRLAPKHLYPAPVEDVADAMAWLRSHSGELGIDTTRFVLLGRSAGGQIALQAAYTAKDPAIKGVIAFYAPADMVFGYSLPTNPLIMDSRLLMEQYLGGGYPAVPEKYVASSPVEHLTASSPPTLLLHGRPDVLVSWRHTVHMRAKMDSLGVRHFIVDVPWGAHGFDYVVRGPGSQLSLYFIERFLAAVTR